MLGERPAPLISTAQMKKLEQSLERAQLKIKELQLINANMALQIDALTQAMRVMEQRHQSAMELAGTDHEIAALRFQLREMTEIAEAREKVINELRKGTR